MTIKPVMHRLGNGETICLLRLTADEGMVLTRNYEDFWNCVDAENFLDWHETVSPEVPDEELYE